MDPELGYESGFTLRAGAFSRHFSSENCKISQNITSFVALI